MAVTRFYLFGAREDGRGKPVARAHSDGDSLTPQTAPMMAVQCAAQSSDAPSDIEKGSDGAAPILVSGTTAMRAGGPPRGGGQSGGGGAVTIFFSFLSRIFLSI